jgi:hypothetical protein
MSLYQVSQFFLVSIKCDSLVSQARVKRALTSGDSVPSMSSSLDTGASTAKRAGSMVGASEKNCHVSDSDVNKGPAHGRPMSLNLDNVDQESEIENQHEYHRDTNNKGKQLQCSE